MGIFKALGKYGAKKINHQVTKSQLAKISDKSYNQTGKEMEKARKNGEWINGSNRFCENKKELKRKTYQKSKDREGFIDDL